MTHNIRTAALAALFLIVPQLARAEVVHCDAGDVLCLILAIDDANAKPQRNTIIHLAEGVYAVTGIHNLTDGPNGLPSIAGHITIKGAPGGGTRLIRDANATPLRLLHVGAQGRLTLESLTVSNNPGREPLDPSSFVPDFNGGGMFNNGGVVTILNSWLTENRAIRGAAIFSTDGVVRMFDSTVSRNGVSSNAPTAAPSAAVLVSGGMLEIARSVIERNSGTLSIFAPVFSGAGGVSTNGAEVVIADSRFTANSAFITGALQVSGGTLLVTGTSFDRNAGNGAHALSLTTGAAGVVRDSAFVDNGGNAPVEGTTFFNSVSTVEVINTTFAGNGIGERFSLPMGVAITNRGTMTIVNSTFADNDDVFMGPASVIFGADESTTRLKNTIVVGGRQRVIPPFRVPACAGQITSLGSNLFDDPSGCGAALQASDILDEAGLGPLTDDGSPGNAHYPLLPSSLAIDAADTRVCQVKDQIGQVRRPRCDIGAVEHIRKEN
jgi:hypothetical protein